MLGLFNLADESTDQHWFLAQIRENKFAKRVGVEGCLRQSLKNLIKINKKLNIIEPICYQDIIEYMCKHYGFVDVETECMDGFIDLRTFDFNNNVNIRY